jgi:hypothetical protein
MSQIHDYFAALHKYHLEFGLVIVTISILFGILADIGNISIWIAMRRNPQKHISPIILVQIFAYLIGFGLLAVLPLAARLQNKSQLCLATLGIGAVFVMMHIAILVLVPRGQMED